MCIGSYFFFFLTFWVKKKILTIRQNLLFVSVLKNVVIVQNVYFLKKLFTQSFSSVGVILYYLIYNQPPFAGNSEYEIYENKLNSNLVFPNH